MKILGIILLVFGILSLIGGLISPSNNPIEIILGGYFFKLAFIIGGIILINKPKKKG